MEIKDFMERAKKIEELELELKTVVSAINSLENDCNYCVSSVNRASFCTISSEYLALGLLEKFKDLYATYNWYINALKDDGVNVKSAFRKELAFYKVVSHLL